MQCMQARKELCVISTETPQTTTNSFQTLLPVYKLAHLPLLTSKTPTTFSSAFFRRCATDVSIRSHPLAKIYLKCISFICGVPKGAKWLIIVYTIINYGMYHNEIWHIPYLNVAYTLIIYSIYHNWIYLKYISFIYMYICVSTWDVYRYVSQKPS